MPPVEGDESRDVFAGKLARRHEISPSVMQPAATNTRSTLEQAHEFLELFAREQSHTQDFNLDDRLEEIRVQLECHGTYEHAHAELVFGARIAWRNSNRCIGRLPWRSLHVLDYRTAHAPRQAFNALRRYVEFATNGGRILPAIAILPPSHPEHDRPPRILNSKLIRYAGYGTDRDSRGDPDEQAFTDLCEALGWRGAGTDFDLLPVVLDMPGYEPEWFEWSPSEALQVPLTHPSFDWFAELGLRWYAVPIVSDMTLNIGGIEYTAAPFNGWFMGAEIGARNLSDESRYDVLPEIAARMKLDTSQTETLWKDRALVELNTSVLHSFKEAEVRIVDHHSVSREFMTFADQEERDGRTVCGDWSWLVPPLAGSTTEVFHRSWPNDIRTPGFFYREPIGLPGEARIRSGDDSPARSGPPELGCPFTGVHRRDEEAPRISHGAT